ncbi:MAG: hypothetical protein PHZ09_09370, partial [Eubacteriales bacterium]|nr:hypothetical protein [Eubacteriales bacterium]
MKRILSLILALVLFTGILAGCSTSDDSGGQQNADGTLPSNADVTAEPDILDGLNYNGATINIQMSATEISSDILMIGSGEQTGDVVNDAVYDRNMAAEEKLNVVLTYVETNYNWDGVTGEMEKLAVAGDSTYHFIVNDQLGLSTASVNHYLVNAYGAAYFDFESDGWWVDYMKDLSLSNDKLYLLVGDYFIDVLNHSHVLLYNRRIFTDLYGDADSIYKQVTDDSWTYDAFNKYITEAYRDVNGDGAKDADDVYGMIIGGIGGSTFPFTYGSDAQFVTRDENGTPTLTMNNERTLLLYDKIYAAF